MTQSGVSGLGDLQWSDAATLEVLAYLAQRRRQVRCKSWGPIGVEVVVSGIECGAYAGTVRTRQCEEWC